MKIILSAFALFLLLSCEDNSQKTDKEKSVGETKIEIKTDSAEVKIGENGVSIKGKDGKVEIKTDDGSKLKIEKKGKELNIQIKEN